MKYNIIRNLLGILVCIHSTSGFVLGGSPMIKLRQNSHTVMQMSYKNNTLIPKTNTSKVFKMDYSEED